MLVNTSFNVRGEPIVCTPEDAFRCFMGTEIELLAVGNCVLRKEDQDPALKQDERCEGAGMDELGRLSPPRGRSTPSTTASACATSNSSRMAVRSSCSSADSFVWGVDAEADERFTNLLREKLPNYTIVNAGVSGFGTDQELLLTRRIWDKIKPDILVLMFCSANDRRDNSNNVRYDDYQKPYFTIEGDALTVHNQPVPKSRQLYIKQDWIVRHSFVARVIASAYVEIVHPRVTVPDPTEKLVDALQDFAQARGAGFLVGLQFPDPPLTQHLAARAVPFTSFEGAKSYGPDSGGHWTPEGHRLVTDRLLALFAETGVLPPAAPARSE